MSPFNAWGFWRGVHGSGGSGTQVCRSWGRQRLRLWKAKRKEGRQAGRRWVSRVKVGSWAGDWPRPPVAPTTPASIDENQERQLLSASRIDNLTQPSCCSLRPESSDRWISGTARSNSINDPTRGGIGGTGLGYVYHAMPCPLRCAALIVGCYSVLCSTFRALAFLLFFPTFLFLGCFSLSPFFLPALVLFSFCRASFFGTSPAPPGGTREEMDRCPCCL